LSRPKESFFECGPHIEFIPKKSNWFEGEDFEGILNMTVSQNGLGPCSVDIVIDGFEYAWMNYGKKRKYEGEL